MLSVNALLAHETTSKGLQTSEGSHQVKVSCRVSCPVAFGLEASNSGSIGEPTKPLEGFEGSQAAHPNA